jgi:hypothetical protein
MNNTFSRVINQNTGDSTLYVKSPREAVITAYAQTSKRDFNTSGYELKYGSTVKKESGFWVMGDFKAL